MESSCGNVGWSGSFGLNRGVGILLKIVVWECCMELLFLLMESWCGNFAWKFDMESWCDNFALNRGLGSVYGIAVWEFWMESWHENFDGIAVGEVTWNHGFVT